MAMCRVFECLASMERQEKRTYEISGNLTSQWIEQVTDGTFMLSATLGFFFHVTLLPYLVLLTHIYIFSNIYIFSFSNSAHPS